MDLLRFTHWFGFSLWIGGALAAMVLSMQAKGEAPAVRVGAYRLASYLHSMVISIGALLTAASGLALTMMLVQSGLGARLGEPGLIVMQSAGLLGALLSLFVGLPTAVKIRGLAVVDDEGNAPPALERFRRRQAVVSSLSGLLALVALAAAAWGR